MIELISVILPAYNCEKYIKKSVSSVLNQTYKDVELIVVDDASTDNTLKILESLDGIKLIKRKINGGTAAALNSGIKESKGNWIKMIGSDDMYQLNSIEKTMELVDENTDTKIIYYTSFFYINENDNIIRPCIEEQFDESYLWTRYYGNQATALIPRMAFDECGYYDEEFRWGEDYEFWLRVTQLYNYKLKFLNIFTNKYRLHSEQLSQRIPFGNDNRIKAKIRTQLMAKNG